MWDKQDSTEKSTFTSTPPACRLQVEASQRLQVLLEALGVKEASLTSTPPQLRLLVAATYYWLQRAKPPPKERLLKALLMGLSNGEALRHRAGIKLKHVLTLSFMI